MSNNTRYTPKNFIKGKIVELIFDQMFREAGRFTILPFGYERTLPELAQYSQEVKYKHVLDNVRHAPDFVLISHDKTEVYMVEVKYRTNSSKEDLVEIAQGIKDQWNSIWLFLATPDKFYFGSCTQILKNGGDIPVLGNGWVPQDIQDKYLALMREFIR
jgi:hypothetical protein